MGKVCDIGWVDHVALFQGMPDQYQASSSLDHSPNL